jgi:hypothetical protein
MYLPKKEKKIKCDNCPAKNSTVRNYIFEGRELQLCGQCARIALRLKAETTVEKK